MRLPSTIPLTTMPLNRDTVLLLSIGVVVCIVLVVAVSQYSKAVTASHQTTVSCTQEPWSCLGYGKEEYESILRNCTFVDPWHCFSLSEIEFNKRLHIDVNSLCKSKTAPCDKSAAAVKPDTSYSAQLIRVEEARAVLGNAQEDVANANAALAEFLGGLDFNVDTINPECATNEDQCPPVVPQKLYVKARDKLATLRASLKTASENVGIANTAYRQNLATLDQYTNHPAASNSPPAMTP